MKKVLFVCSQNQWRSPTAELVFASGYGIETASAGTNRGAQNPVSGELLEWADVIVVMENVHREKIQKTFHAALKNKRIVCLDIPDDYVYMDDALIALVKSKAVRFL
jgi:predicted protein tyrosine phosphatase